MGATQKMMALADRSVVPIATGATGALIAQQFPQSRGTLKPIKIREKNVGTKKRGNRHSKRENGKFAPVVKSDDPLFNHEAAKKAYDLVMKADTNEEAEMFAYFVMADILTEDITKNQRTLQRHLDEVAKRRIDRVKKALLTSVSKGATEESVAYAQALAVIEKAYTNPYQTGHYQFDESDFRRDRGGRFTTKVQVNHRKKPLPDRAARSIGIKVDGKGYQGLTKEERAQYQQEYLQIANFLNVTSQAGGGDSIHRLMIQDKDGGQRYYKNIDGPPRIGDWDPKTERVVEVESRPAGLTLGGASYNLVGGLSREHMDSINTAEAKFGDFSRDWSDPERDPLNPNHRLYSRIATGSQFVSDVAPDSALKTQTAARLARAVGEHGPQAEKVLGPAARRTAYRYRGVSKTPDKAVVRDYDAAVGRGEKPQLSEAQRKQLVARQNRAVANYRTQKAKNAGKMVETISVTEAEKKQVRGDIERRFMEQVSVKPDPEAQKRAVVAGLGGYLMNHKLRPNKIPSRDLYRLQLESGGTPPSEGFLLDKNGKVVTQAVGYGDDHYLPFNLKELKSLNGGEYIRSRSVGGPTSEDIYTGLMAGASRVTVVSRSGTFIVNFDDDFKGGRRYNDKAARMVRRYQKLLDTVQSEDLERPTSLDIETRKRIIEEVRSEPGAAGLSPRDFRDEVNGRISEYKSDLSSSKEDFEMTQLERTRDLSDEERNAFMAQARKDWDAHHEYKFRLNGAGYRDALIALEEQFPYYFHTEYIARHETEEGVSTVETERDLGYVEPGRLKPTGANAGWRGTATNKGPAFGNNRLSASQTNYQRGTYGAASDRPVTNRVGGRQATVEQRERAAEERTEETTPTTENGSLTPVPEVTQEKVKEIEAKGQEGFSLAAVGLIKALQEHANLTDSAKSYLPVLNETDDAKIAEFFKDKNNVRKADEFLSSASDAISAADAAPALQEAYTNYRKAAGKLGRVSYDPKLALVRDNAPMLFKGAAYETGADPSLAEEEARVIGERTRPVSITGKPLNEMSDQELNEEIDVLTRVKAELDAAKDLKGMDKVKALQANGVDVENPGVSALLEGGRLGRHAKEVQRMRALNLSRGDRTPSVETLPVQRIAPRTSKEIQANKDAATSLAGALEEAASTLESHPDPRRRQAATHLRAAAADFKELTRRDELDAGAYFAILDARKPMLHLGGRVNAGKVEESDIEEFLREHDND